MGSNKASPKNTDFLLFFSPATGIDTSTVMIGSPTFADSKRFFYFLYIMKMSVGKILTK